MRNESKADAVINNWEPPRLNLYISQYKSVLFHRQKMCLAPSTPLNFVAEAMLYAPIFSVQKKSPIRRFPGNCSDTDILSKLSHVGPTTAQTSVLPFLNAL